MTVENTDYGVHVRHTGFITASYKNPAMPDPPEPAIATKRGLCKCCGDEFHATDEIYSDGKRNLHRDCAYAWYTSLNERDVMEDLGFWLEIAGGADE